MSLGVCLPDLMDQGKVPRARGQQLLQRYRRMVASFEPALGRAGAEAKATDALVKLMESELRQAKRRAGLQVRAQKAWLARRRAETGTGPIDAAAAVDELARLDKRIDAVRNTMLVRFDEFLARHRRNLLGQLRNRSDLVDVVRARFGERVDDANVRELAEAMGQAMDMARQRFNAAGGHIGKLDDYGFPQRHDARLVGAVPFEEWLAFSPIERARVRDVETGEFATGLRRQAILRAAYERISTDGGAAMTPGSVGAGSLANRRADPRVIHFENADDWLAYLERFGGTDNVYDVFVGHLSSMARDIVMMEAMGPNPAATLRFQQDWLEKSAKQAKDWSAIDRTVGRKDALQHVYDELTGANKAPANRQLALGFSAFRSLQVASKLGSAILSAVPDFATLAVTAGYNRVPVMQTFGRYLTLWNPAAEGDRRLAVRLGLVTDEYLALSSATARYTGEELTGEISRRMADFTMRAQGLGRHTRNGQWAFGMEFLGHLTDMRERPIGALDPALQRQMAHYGIGAGDWDAYRATAPKDERGTGWIFPTDVAERRVGERVLEMVLAETDHALIMPDIRTRSLLGRARPGSLGGEILKSTLLFKSFPLAILNLHGRRMLEQAGGWNKARYAVALAGLMMAGGAVSVQLKLLASGKDPQPMDDPRFWGRATAQSGAFGLVGDLMYNSTNSYGGGLAQTLAGPGVELATNVGDLTIGNAVKLLDGDAATETDAGRDLSRLIRSEVPFRSLWYSRLAWERLFADQVQGWLDEDVETVYARMERRAGKEGTAYWWRPGELAPGRAPDLPNAFGRVDGAPLPE